MVGKVMIGKSFGGCVRYNLQRDEATILHAEGIRAGNIQTIIDDFNMQRKMNPGLGKAVGHIVLSWSSRDRDKLTPETMIDRAKEYMQQMKIADTQFLIVQHTDRQHPHIHLIYNRVDNQGKAISDQNQRRRNAEVCKSLTTKHNYYIAPGKEQVNRHRLAGADKIKYQLYDVIKLASATARNWKELEHILKKQGIGIEYKFRSGTQQIQGISFSKGDVRFKGSEIDRNMSYGKLSERLSQNADREMTSQHSESTFLAGHAEPAIGREPLGAGRLAFELLDGLLRTSAASDQPDHDLLRRKKRKHSQGLRR